MKKEKLLMLFLALFLTMASGYAQVNIGSSANPNQNALLDLQQGPSGKGLLMPTVSLISITDISSFTSPLAAGMMVYNTGANTAFPYKGVYVWNGSQWQSTATRWFYMPSIALNVQYSGSGKISMPTVNLYTKYTEQLDPLGTPSIFKASPGAPAIETQIPKMTTGTDFYYYVLGYDSSVFADVSIDADGTLHYSLLKEATDATYMNIIFVPKS